MFLDALLEVGKVEVSSLFLPVSGREVMAHFAEGEFRVINSVVSKNIESAVRNQIMLFRYRDSSWIQDEMLAEMGIVGYRADLEIHRIYLISGINSSEYFDVGLSLGLFGSIDSAARERVLSLFEKIRNSLKLFSIFSISKTQVVCYFWDVDDKFIRPLIEEIFIFNREVLNFSKPLHESEDEIENCIRKGFFWLGDG